ncbi:hypothetical protein TCAL_07099, partial [Tigriopus californicus]
YAPKFRKLKADLEARLGDKIEVTYEATPSTTGKFEVTLVDSGKVLHSKIGGDGYVDNNDKLEKIVKVDALIRILNMTQISKFQKENRLGR